MAALFPDGVFFLDWPTWARLAIILAGLLTITLIAGFCVKLRNWRKNIRMERRAAEEEAERGQVGLMSRSSDDIPFGIRALLENSEVEGVWDSRKATPLHYPPAQRGPPASLLHPTEVPKEFSTSSTCLYDTPDVCMAAPNGGGLVTDPSALIDPPPGALSSKPKKKRLIINYNGPSTLSDTVTTPAVQYIATQAKLGISPSTIHLRSLTNQPSSGTRKFVIRSRQKNSPRYNRADLQSEIHPLERMEAHRRFHAAESGQLLPRDRRHTDLILTTPLAPSLSDSEDNEPHSARASSWPSGMEGMNLGIQLSRKAERLEGPRPVPFRAFVESLPSTKAPPSAWTHKIQAKLDANVPTPSTRSDTTNSKTPTHTPKSSISSTATSAPTSPADSISIASVRTRKVNDGFEVLPAGTLAKGPSVKEFGLWPENAKAGSKPKKLRKSQSSSGSRRSSTESRRLSDDSFRLPIF